MKNTTVIIVDDHQLIRHMFAKMFENNPEIRVVGQSGTLNASMELIKDKRPDLVLLDINLSHDSGFDAVPLIRKHSPGTKIIAVSMHTQPSYAKKMLHMGAKGYITKNSSSGEILKAIDEVTSGKIYVCDEIKDILSDRFIDDSPDAPDTKKLSVREMEVAKYMKDGLSSKDISLVLHISSRTVEVHRYNILKKLKLKNTASMVNFINNSDLNFI